MSCREVVLLNTTQITDNNQINQSLFVEKDPAVENKVKSIVSQLPGKVRNISFRYNKKSVTKAKITIVVSSKEEAIKVRQNIDDEIDIKVIIRDELKEEKESPDTQMNKNQDNNLNDDLISNDRSKNIYSFNRGPGGKIYGIIKEKRDNISDAYTLPSQNSSINNKLSNKYLNIYKRYDFKNIKVKDKQENNKFSMNI